MIAEKVTCGFCGHTKSIKKQAGDVSEYAAVFEAAAREVYATNTWDITGVERRSPTYQEAPESSRQHARSLVRAVLKVLANCDPELMCAGRGEIADVFPGLNEGWELTIREMSEADLTELQKLSKTIYPVRWGKSG